MGYEAVSEWREGPGKRERFITATLPLCTGRKQTRYDSSSFTRVAQTCPRCWFVFFVCTLDHHSAGAPYITPSPKKNSCSSLEPTTSCETMGACGSRQKDPVTGARGDALTRQKVKPNTAAAATRKGRDRTNISVSSSRCSAAVMGSPVPMPPGMFGNPNGSRQPTARLPFAAAVSSDCGGGCGGCLCGRACDERGLGRVLPIELLRDCVLPFLDARCLARAGGTCSTWREAAIDEHLWKPLCLRHWVGKHVGELLCVVVVVCCLYLYREDFGLIILQLFCCLFFWGGGYVLTEKKSCSF